MRRLSTSSELATLLNVATIDFHLHTVHGGGGGVLATFEAPANQPIEYRSRPRYKLRFSAYITTSRQEITPVTVPQRLPFNTYFLKACSDWGSVLDVAIHVAGSCGLVSASES